MAKSSDNRRLRKKAAKKMKQYRELLDNMSVRDSLDHMAKALSSLGILVPAFDDMPGLYSTEGLYTSEGLIIADEFLTATANYPPMQKVEFKWKVEF
jgi:hypothetical protein